MKFPLPLHPLSPTALFFFKQVTDMARLIPRAVFAVVGGVKFLFGSVSLNWTPCMEIWAVYPQFVPDSQSLSSLRLLLALSCICGCPKSVLSSGSRETLGFLSLH